MASPPTIVPCEQWATPEEVQACCPGLDPGFDLTNAIRFATATLFRLSGRQYPGVCTRTVYPCLGSNCGCALDDFWHFDAADWYWLYSGVPGLWGGFPAIPIPSGLPDAGFVNVGCCNGRCQLNCVDLPSTVNSIIEVVIDGEVVDPNTYRIEAYRRLCRVGTTDGFPCSNNLAGISCVNTDLIETVTVDAVAGNWQITVDVGSGPQSALVGATDAAAVVQAALEALPGVGVGNVTVSGGPGAAGGGVPYVITFDVVAIGAVPIFSVANISLVGGASTVGFVVTQAGCLADPGTWHITYEYGKPVPEEGRFVAAIFACQIALNQCGADGCILPQRLKEITRQGVEMAFADPLEFLDQGKVGIYEVDLWLESVNPKRITRRARVYRADVRPDFPGNITTWTS